MIRVLVVDDEEAVRETISVILGSEEDLDVVGWAADGGQAVERARQLRPDVVVMDLRMPGGDGVTATRRLRELGLPIAVLALTTFATEETAVDAIRAGAAGFCAKADPPDALIRATRAAANGDAVVSPPVLGKLLNQLATSDEPPAPPPDCSKREVEVLALVAEGADNAEIASELVISDATVRSHIGHLRSKLSARSRAQLVVRAVEFGIKRR